jgi:hypothetical protein
MRSPGTDTIFVMKICLSLGSGPTADDVRKQTGFFNGEEARKIITVAPENLSRHRIQ